MDAAVLVKERSTGKLGIAIVHGTTGKVTILGAGFGIGNGGDDFEWMYSWQVYSKTRNVPRLPWRRTSGGEKRSRQRIDLLEW
jgi:hypothetical protein